MSEWKEYKLNSFCKVGSSKRIFSSEYVPFGIPFFRSKEIIEKSFGDSINELLFISEEKFREIDTKYGSPKEGDILISSVGARSGIPYLVKKEDGEFYFKDGNLIWIKDFSENLDSNFLLYWFKSNIGQDSFQSITIGSAQPALTIDGISNLFIKLPDVKTQKQIADILSCLDAKIENLRRQNETLEQIAQALFKHWFIDFEFLNADGKPYKSSGGGMFASELGDIPEGWKVGNFGDIVVNFDRQRIPLSSNERQKRQGIYPYYGATSIMDYVDDYLFDGLYILMGEDGTVIDDQGYPVLQYVFEKFWVNNHAHVLQGKNEYSSNFIYLFLKQTKINNIVTGAVQPKINQANMNGIKLVIPKIEQVKLFDLIINPIFEKKMNNIFQIQTLTKTRDSVLPKLMSGQLRVKE